MHAFIEKAPTITRVKVTIKILYIMQIHTFIEKAPAITMGKSNE